MSDYDRILQHIHVALAWAEAEAALPTGWAIDRIVRDWDRSSGDNWRAYANRGDGSMVMESGATPAAALRALAAKLRESPPG